MRRITLVLLATLVAIDASAGPRDFAIHVTRMGGDTATAQPYIDKFLRWLEAEAHWPAGASKGALAIARKDAIAFVTATKPGLGILDPALYFELRKAQALTPILQVESKDLYSSKLHVVVKDPALKSLADLKGKRLWTLLGDSNTYLSKVVLDGKVDAATYFALKAIPTALKGVKGVMRAECDATLLDDDQLEQAKKLPGGADLRIVFTSPALPPIPVVVFGASLPAADKDAVVKSLTAMCGSPKGADICKELHFTRLVPVDAAAFAAAQKRYGD